jgi:hypothetical protein
MSDTNLNRPPEMEQLTETQLQELEVQFDESDREQSEELASTYGWSPDVIQRVWDWFASGDRARGS